MPFTDAEYRENLIVVLENIAYNYILSSHKHTNKQKGCIHRPYLLLGQIKIYITKSIRHDCSYLNKWAVYRQTRDVWASRHHPCKYWSMSVAETWVSVPYHQQRIWCLDHLNSPHHLPFLSDSHCHHQMQRNCLHLPRCRLWWRWLCGWSLKLSADMSASA